ncbi:Chaperonin-like RbcX [Dillenia turbinata]|uniref:Chaperonin-like RbcX n=1 Tax=Dillenia turbinata TaxID=194707 RepID=A0AAN8VD15_9MAGN
MPRLWWGSAPHNSSIKMESSAVLTVSQISSFPSNPNNRKGVFSPNPCRLRTSQHSTRLNCQKMFVPGFGASPEAKAACNLHNFFTYIAVKIVSAQLESYNPEAYEELMEFAGRHSLNDGDKFCESLMRESSRHKNLGTSFLLLFGIQHQCPIII